MLQGACSHSGVDVVAVGLGRACGHQLRSVSADGRLDRGWGSACSLHDAGQRVRLEPVEAPHKVERTGWRWQPVLRLLGGGRLGLLDVDVDRAVGVAVQLGAVVDHVPVKGLGTKNPSESYMVSDQNPLTGGSCLAGVWTT